MVAPSTTILVTRLFHTLELPVAFLKIIVCTEVLLLGSVQEMQNAVRYILILSNLSLESIAVSSEANEQYRVIVGNGFDLLYEFLKDPVSSGLILDCQQQISGNL